MTAQIKIARLAYVKARTAQLRAQHAGRAEAVAAAQGPVSRAALALRSAGQ